MSIPLKKETIEVLEARVIASREKYPNNRTMLAGLVGEVGELAVALMTEGPERIRDEALDVAAVALRLFEEGDATHEGVRRDGDSS